MNSFTHMKRYVRLLSLLLVSLFILSCGDGGGSGGSPAVNLDTNAVETGNVAILLTDGPSEVFDEINVTITGIELISDETKVMLYSGQKTFDLLRLEDESALFSLTSDVPAIAYNKIRLHVSDMELIRRDIDGTILELVHPKLPGNGKLDLNPRSTFLVEPNCTLILQIDVDANKSIHIKQTGNQKYIVRPVVFVTVIDGLSRGKLARLEGFVTNLDPTENSFELCPSQAAFRAEVRPLGDNYDGNGLDTNDCVTIWVSNSTSIFDTDGSPAGFSALIEDDYVTVIGQFRITTNGDEPHWAGFDAEIIEIGQAGTFLKLSGTVLSAPDANGTFDFSVDPGQGILGNVTVELQTGTKVFSRPGYPLLVSDIEAGMTATIDGVLVVSNTVPDRLKAALVVLNVLAPPALDRIEGTAFNIDYNNGSFDLSISPTVTACVTLTPDTMIFLTTAGPVTESGCIGNVPLTYMDEGDMVYLAGAYDSTGCFVPDFIWIEKNGPIIIE